MKSGASLNRYKSEQDVRTPRDFLDAGVAMIEKLQAPFPWFGGKSRVSHLVWERFGYDIYNYVEPFFGSGAVLLNRKLPDKNVTETVNDLDGFVANFWRAVQADPEQVAHYTDWPQNENDLHARHIWLVQQKERLQARIEGDFEYCDPKIAGYWVWGISCWIGSGFCSGQGAWNIVNGELVKTYKKNGIARQLLSLKQDGQGIHSTKKNKLEWIQSLSDRLKKVRVCSGDWSRVCGPSVTFYHGLTGVFLDPPYADTAGRSKNLYNNDSLSVAHDVRRWALENGNNPKLRIALCGYEGEHKMPDDWECVKWTTNGGFSNQSKGKNENKKRERIWFSPHCLKPYKQRSLFND